MLVESYLRWDRLCAQQIQLSFLDSLAFQIYHFFFSIHACCFFIYCNLRHLPSSYLPSLLAFLVSFLLYFWHNHLLVDCAYFYCNTTDTCICPSIIIPLILPFWCSLRYHIKEGRYEKVSTCHLSFLWIFSTCNIFSFTILFCHVFSELDLILQADVLDNSLLAWA